MATKNGTPAEREDREMCEQGEANAKAFGAALAANADGLRTAEVWDGSRTMADALNSMIDAAVKCVKCGAQGVGNCLCWTGADR